MTKLLHLLWIAVIALPWEPVAGAVVYKIIQQRKEV